jgi:hypothetical protein
MVKIAVDDAYVVHIKPLQITENVPILVFDVSALKILAVLFLAISLHVHILYALAPK